MQCVIIFFVHHGPPKLIMTDKGREFTSALFQEVCHFYQVENIFTSTFHPQSNGIVERFNQTLVDYLAKSKIKTVGDKEMWDDYLSCFLMAYNGTYHRAIGMSPHKAHYGYDMRSIGGNPIDAAGTVVKSEHKEPHQIVHAHQNALKQAKLQLERYNAKQREWANKSRRTPNIKVGDYVFLRVTPRQKINRPYTGPWIVTDTDGTRPN